MKMKILSQMAKLIFTQSKESLSRFPLSQVLSWQLGRLVAHTSETFWQPQRQELTWGVESAWKTDPEEPGISEIWDLKRVDNTGHPTALKVLNPQCWVPQRAGQGSWALPHTEFSQKRWIGSSETQEIWADEVKESWATRRNLHSIFG